MVSEKEEFAIKESRKFSGKKKLTMVAVLLEPMIFPTSVMVFVWYIISCNEYLLPAGGIQIPGTIG